MYRFIKQHLVSFLTITFLAVFATGNARADGEIGDHVNDLSAHLEEYAGEVDWLLEKANGIVRVYESDGAGAAQPGKMIDHWEAVKFHAAIETSYAPVYANIWQGIYGIKQAIEQGKPVSAVKEQQALLEKALWQALGAVKLAAQQQQLGTAVKRNADSGASSPVATLDEIKLRLDRVVAKYAEKKFDEAKSLVHATYAERFEGVEGVLIEQDAVLVEDLEKDFNVTLPLELEGDASVDAVKTIVNSMHRKLDRAKALLAKAEQERKDVF